MQILIHYPFAEQEVEAFRELARRYGDHEVLFAVNEQEAIEQAGEIEVLMGHYLPTVCAAAPHLRWIQSFSTGQDKFLFPEIIAREAVMISNVAGLYATQGAEHAWALLLALTRGIAQAVRNQDKHQWKYDLKMLRPKVDPPVGICYTACTVTPTCISPRWGIDSDLLDHAIHSSRSFSWRALTWLEVISEAGGILLASLSVTRDTH